MGNRSLGAGIRGVHRTRVRLPGFLVSAEICIPKAHSHALWLLPWVERLIQGESLEAIQAAPPWPVPGEPLVARQLVRELIDLRWAVPDWAGTGVVVAPRLVEAHREGGRPGLARALFDVDVHTGEWWMDALGGTILSRQTATAFDWDFRTKAEVVLEATRDPRAILDEADPDLPDLMLKLGGNDLLWEARDRAFLGTRLTIGAPKQLLFTMFGDDVRILPDELAELEPALGRLAPSLFGERPSSGARAAQVEIGPVDRLLQEAEKLHEEPEILSPIDLVRRRVECIQEMIERDLDGLFKWLTDGQEVHPVAGDARRHLEWLAGALSRLDVLPPDRRLVLLTSAFLNPDNLRPDEGLLAVLVAAPPGTRVLLVHGHASDDLPSVQQDDMARYLRRIQEIAPALAPRVTVVAGARRSHEKVIVTSAGDWLLGSWNAASSRASSPTFECSLAGRDPSFAGRLRNKLAENLGDDSSRHFAEAIGACLNARSGADRASNARACVSRLQAAVGSLLAALPAGDANPGKPWRIAVRALRGALHPFATTTKLSLVDEKATRDVLIGLLRSARGDIVLASDRLAHSGLDAATLRDLRGNHRDRTVRIIWGREAGPGRVAGDGESANQVRRAQRMIQDAKDALGASLLTSDDPMANHAKLLLADGRRGIVTSENVLAYGGERGRGDSRELGLAFSGAALAQHLLDAVVRQWPDALVAPDAPHGNEALARIVAGGGLPLPAPHGDSSPDVPARRAPPAQSIRRDHSAAPRSPPSAVSPIIAAIMKEMVRIQSGAFVMGDDRVAIERPRHRVVISRPFLLGARPVTQDLWESVMGGLPFLRDVERHPGFPIIQVGYADICRFLDKLNALPGGGGFDLPTEAQWEYACRAGANTVYCFGDDPGGGKGPGILERYAWTKRSGKAQLQRVGLLQPNAWGLYDMHGLVYETMRDGRRTYSKGEIADPIGPLDGKDVVARGGFWGRFPIDERRADNEHFRCASRQVHEKSFRVSFRLFRQVQGGR